MPSWPEITAAGVGIGILFGMFGVGGSSFATPVLGLMGVPGLIAITAPLPAVIPSAMVAMTTYVRRKQVEWSVAKWSIYGGVPGTILGASLSGYVGGKSLLIASGVVLAAVGVRILAPLADAHLAGHARRRPAVVIPAAAAIGVFTGLLANGGGFLLVPLFVDRARVDDARVGRHQPGRDRRAVGADPRHPLVPRAHRLGRRRCVRPRVHPRRLHRLTTRPAPAGRVDASRLRHPADRVRRLLRRPRAHHRIADHPSPLPAAGGRGGGGGGGVGAGSQRRCARPLNGRPVATQCGQLVRPAAPAHSLSNSSKPPAASAKPHNVTRRSGSHPCLGPVGTRPPVFAGLPPTTARPTDLRLPLRSNQIGQCRAKVARSVGESHRMRVCLVWMSLVPVPVARTDDVGVSGVGGWRFTVGHGRGFRGRSG